LGLIDQLREMEREMKVEKVIISGEMPETCRDCDFMEYVSFSTNFDNQVSDVFWCNAKCEAICEAVEFHKDPVNKPDWCPLRQIQP
jgi:D-ribose pyranose/furanose isomerase RbsD